MTGVTDPRGIHVIVTGRWEQNGYVVEGVGKQAIVIDPGKDVERYEDLLRESGLTPAAIINTHAHYDHIGAVQPLIDRYSDLPFYLHAGDRALLRQANLYRILFEATEKLTVPTDFIDLAAVVGKATTIAGLDVHVVSTPGHTAGSVCFRIGSHLFGGDTLLPNGPGRTDLPGGSKAQMAESLELLKSWREDGFQLHPGHGRSLPLAQALQRVVEGETSSRIQA